MRPLFAVAASGCATLGAVVASLDAHADYVPFFGGLAFCAALTAGVAHEPFVGDRRRVARAAAGIWVVAATWVGVLLIMAATVWQASGPPPTPDQTFVGIPATVWYLVALYGGSALMVCSVMLPRSTPEGSAPARSDRAEVDRVMRDPV
jgi:hypothetical protein